jgi:hypothetical protein
MPTITDLPSIVAALPVERRACFERIFHVDVVEGECRIPDPMQPWVKQHLGPLHAVEHQQVVRVTNAVTFDGALYNPLRAGRPVQLRPTSEGERPVEDMFAEPFRMTAEDVFGRVRGQFCITTSNVARWDGQCAVLIFDEFDSLRFRREHIRDYLRTALAWARRAHEHDPQARYFVWMWNGGLKGGASIPHAHAQIGLGRHHHYAFVERLRRAALAYRARHGSEYFSDLLAAHEDVGLGISAGDLNGFICLAANRPKDIWIFGRAFDDALADALYDVLRGLIDRSGTGAFNVGVMMPPIFPPPDASLRASSSLAGESGEDWSGFPVILRLGDRGSPDMISSDIGAMDLYGQNVIAIDPFSVKGMLGP